MVLTVRALARCEFDGLVSRHDSEAAGWRTGGGATEGEGDGAKADGYTRESLWLRARALPTSF